ncbi:MAG TPA: endo-1,4-beta-xylanase [Tepidisphaeraceae bacterium]|jgi:GH35 family endo-1,4-beta-xylanase|nr:endo-1,4-beta-xylanase [Tepidisphaeraceae bacterium]
MNRRYLIGLIVLLTSTVLARAEQSLLSGDWLEKPSTHGATAAGAEVQSVPVDGQPFKQALRIQTSKQVPNAWSYELQLPNIEPIERGDVVLVTFYARSQGKHAVTQFAYQRNAPDYQRSAAIPVDVDNQWQRFDVPFEAIESYGVGKAVGVFWLGYPPQTIEIGGISITNYAKEKKLADLPRTSLTYAGREADAPWRKEADERIEKYRKGDIVINVVDQKGNSVSGADVSVQMRRHAFGFGSCVQAAWMNKDSPDADRYRQTIASLFNRVVFENDLKWTSWDRENLPAAIDWLHAHNIDIRGHNLIWPSWQWTPGWLQQFKNDKPGLSRAIAMHIEQMVSTYRGQLYDWDVVNELFSHHDISDLLGPQALAGWFQLARKNDPYVHLYINDFDILENGGHEEVHQQAYYDTIRSLLEQNAPLDGIGMQSHFGQRVTSPERLLEILNWYGSLGPMIEVTEFDVDTKDEQLQADYLRDFLTVMFSHPKVDGFLMWGFWQKLHWRPDAAMFRTDWSEKPSAKVFKDLVFTKWWTDVAGKTDQHGTFSTRGFCGQYEITATAGAQKARLPASVSRDGLSLTLVLK